MTTIDPYEAPAPRPRSEPRPAAPEPRAPKPEPTLPEKLYAEVRSTRVAAQTIAWVVCIAVAINLIVGWIMAAQLIHLAQPAY